MVVVAAMTVAAWQGRAGEEGWFAGFGATVL